VNTLTVFDGMQGAFRSLRVRPDPACPVCGSSSRR